MAKGILTDIHRMVADLGPNVPRLCPGLNGSMPLPDHKHNALHYSACGRDNRVRHCFSRRGSPNPRSSSLNPRRRSAIGPQLRLRMRLSRRQFGVQRTLSNDALTTQVDPQRTRRLIDDGAEFKSGSRRALAPEIGTAVHRDSAPLTSASLQAVCPRRESCTDASVLTFNGDNA